MKEPNPESNLIVKIILALIWLVLGLLLVGLLWGFYQERTTAVMVGLAVLVIDLVFILVPYWGRAGRKAGLDQTGGENGPANPVPGRPVGERDWPEFEAAQQTKRAQSPTGRRPRLSWATSTEQKYRDSLTDPALRKATARWRPPVATLLERVAQATLWGEDLSDDFGMAEPLHITVRPGDHHQVVWQVGGTLTMTWGNAGAYSIEYFEVTLELGERFEPLNFMVESKTLSLRVEPGVEDLKAALVQAYLDGPKINRDAWY